ncbi:MAG: polynucleotide adenylyltransferase PcnB [Deltaproteobacteria bacterium]|nr:polynucleotide adenylyltransferase PcnB [Deltaproteobacteria bacterium]
MNKTPLPSVVTAGLDLPAPLVISPTEHPVSIKDIDSDALMVLRRLHEAGFAAYLVGGGVRDLFLGKTPKDFDISTSAKPGQVKKVFRNCRIIGRRFRLAQVFFGGGKIIEVATFRRPGENDIGGDDVVLPSNNSFGNPAEDAFRRDLTINALFYDIEHSTIIDYIGGVKDLEDRVVRIVGDPERRITRDPVRMMRVIRHAARADFQVEPATWEAICRHKDKLSLCPVSRIRDELFKDLKGGASSAWFKLACDSGLFHVIFPFYEKVLVEHAEAAMYMKNMAQNLEVSDRLAGEGQTLPDGLLMALVLLPWAETEMDFAAVSTQRDAYVLSRSIRDNLVEMFGKLNIKRSMQDDIARSLATLPLLHKHDNDDKAWPKWLQKKSYFKSGMQLFQLAREAGGGDPAHLPFAAPEPAAVKKSGSSNFRQHAPNGGHRGPAFALNTKGGVFGFRN